MNSKLKLLEVAPRRDEWYPPYPSVFRHSGSARSRREQTCSVNAAGGTLAIDCNGPGASVKSVPASSTITMHLTIPIEGWGAL